MSVFCPTLLPSQPLRWSLVGRVASAENESSRYTPCANDVNCIIQGSCIPIRSDGQRGKAALSSRGMIGISSVLPTLLASPRPYTLHYVSAHMYRLTCQYICTTFVHELMHKLFYSLSLSLCAAFYLSISFFLWFPTVCCVPGLFRCRSKRGYFFVPQKRRTSLQGMMAGFFSLGFRLMFVTHDFGDKNSEYVCRGFVRVLISIRKSC